MSLTGSSDSDIYTTGVISIYIPGGLYYIHNVLHGERYQYNMDFMSLEEIKEKLLTFENDPSMNTEGRYSPTAADWPDSILPFSEIHLAYLRKNKSVNPAHYLSNLELMIRK